MKLMRFVSACLAIAACFSTNGRAEGLEAIMLQEIRTFTSFTQRGEVYYEGAFVCFVELRGIDGEHGGLDDSSASVSAVAGHEIASHHVSVTTESGVQKLSVFADNRLDSNLLLQSSSLDNAKNGIFFHLGDSKSQQGVDDANGRLIALLGTGGSKVLFTSFWLPEEVHPLTGYERPGSPPQNVFSPGMCSASTTFSWKMAQGDHRDMLVKVVDTHRARVEVVLQSLDSMGNEADTDQDFKIALGTTNSVSTLFSITNNKSRIHRFLFNPDKPDSLPFPAGPGNPVSSVWVLQPALLGSSPPKSIIKSVSVQLVRALPTTVWNHGGVEKKLTVLSPVTLNPEKVKSLKVQWKAVGFSDNDVIEILGTLNDSTGEPVLIKKARPYEGFEDGLNGMVMLDTSAVSSIAATQPAIIKLVFRLTQATPPPSPGM